MKRIFALLFALLLSLMLCACGNGLCFDEKPTIQFARDNAALLAQCTKEICSEYLSNGWRSTLFFSEDARLFLCENTTDREATRTEINSDRLSELFRTGKIKKIFVWSEDGAVRSIVFLVDSIGMGSSSYAEIDYIPADRIEDAFFYSDCMHFDAFREGFLGEIDGSDNYLYYVRISPCWFYIEYGD
jgi:hypothetical protein